MELPINTLLEWDDPTNPITEVERVLRVDGERGIAYVINVKLRKGMPKSKTLAEIKKALENDVAHILKEDPWLIPISYEANSKRIAARDRAWAIIEPIINLPDPFDVHARGQAVQTAAISLSFVSIYKLLRKYWQGGQTKDALLPRLHHCGAPGVSRVGKTAKTGPKSKSINKPGKTLTDADLKKMDMGITLFYDTREKQNKSKAYEDTKERFYNDGYHRKGNTDVPMVLPPSEVPSRRQFIYRIETTGSIAKSLRKRHSKKEFNLKLRGAPGKHEVTGPGFCYAIDATIADVYIISDINPNQTVCRPTLYLVTDYYSKMIVGFHITREHTSYINAAAALENAASSKTEFCKQFGITIPSEVWPCQHIPSVIMADGGELSGPIAKPIFEALGCRLDNTPPYRADLKGVVERMFKYLNDELLHSLPGSVDKNATRGDQNPAELATLTLHELTKLVITWAIRRNHEALEAFRPDQNNVEATPTAIGLWNWGIVNGKSSLKQFPSEHLKKALLPKGDARLRRAGIIFKKNHYLYKSMEETKRMFEEYGSIPLPCHFDPRDASIIHICFNNKLEACYLRDKMAIGHQISWEEMSVFDSELTEKKAEAKADAAQHRANLNAAIKQAKEIPVARGANGSLSEKAENIREARRAEIARTRTAPQRPPPAPTNIIPMDSTKEAHLKLLESLNT